MMHPRAWMTAAFAAAAFWGVVLLAEVPVEVGQASLPKYDEIEQAIDERVGEKRIDDAEKEVNERFTKEKAAYEQEFGGVVDDLGANSGISDIVAAGKAQSDVYQSELAQRARSELSTELLQDGYTDMKDEHTAKLRDIETVKSSNNDIMSKVSEHNRVYEKQKFLISR